MCAAISIRYTIDLILAGTYIVYLDSSGIRFRGFMRTYKVAWGNIKTLALTTNTRNADMLQMTTGKKTFMIKTSSLEYLLEYFNKYLDKSIFEEVETFYYSSL